MPVNLTFPKIIQAYMQGKNLRLAEETQQRDEEFRQKKLTEDIRQFDENARIHQQEFAEENKIRGANLRLAQMAAKRAITRDAAEGIIPGTPRGENEIVVQDPELGEIVAPSPEALAKRQGIFKTQAIADKVAELNATLPILDEASKKKEERAQKRALEIQEMRGKTAREVAEMRVANQLSLEDLRNRYRVSNILLRKSLQDGGETEDVELATNDALKGIYSVEDFIKLGFKPAQRTAILRSVQKAGGRILNEKETIDLKNLTALNAYIRQIDEMHDEIEKGGSGIFTNPSKLAELYGRSKEIESGLGNLATSLGGQKGAISQKDVEAQKSYIPTINPLMMGRNKARRKNLHDARQAKINSIFGNIPKAQRQAIVEEFQLEDESAIQLPPGFKLKGGK